MELWSIFLLACALSMDAFAVSLCKGFSTKSLRPSHYAIVGAYFGGFQAIMPLLGYALGIALASFISRFDHWIAFILLAFIGIKMIKESFERESCDKNSNEFAPRFMLPLAIATSIDALAVGVSFAMLSVNIWISVAIIGVLTAIFSAFALKIGNRFGLYLGKKAELLGGAILVILGLKILLEHLF